MALTKKQRALVDELQEMRDLMLLNYEQIEEYPAPSRTTSLLLMRNKLVRGQVVVSYTLIDEFLTNRICCFIFGRQRSFPDLWKTKRFRLFNHYVVESLSLLEKLRFAKAIQEIPKPIARKSRVLTCCAMGWRTRSFPRIFDPPSQCGKAMMSSPSLASVVSTKTCNRSSITSGATRARRARPRRRRSASLS